MTDPDAPLAAMTYATEELFRDDADRLDCEATVVAVVDQGLILDRTVFYPLGGGQAGDTGRLETESGAVLPVVDTRKASAGGIVHVPARGAEGAAFPPGTRVRAVIDAERRRAHRRLHTTTHLLCALVPHPVNGCSITATGARLDFHMTEPLDKALLDEGLARFVAQARPVRHRWIDEAELDANPGLVRSMSVQPPRGLGRIRVVEVEGIDLQPCGGTHVANTADIGAVRVVKIEKKSAMTRRVVLGFGEPAGGT